VVETGEVKNIIEKKDPLVSVGIPTYNRPIYLQRALECITGQTYKNIEIIVSDNCSPGYETESVVRKFMETDKRIRYFRQNENIGGLNGNFVLEKAVGEYFMFAADDDEWDKDFIKNLLNGLLKNKDCIVAFCPYHYIDEAGKIRGKEFVYDYSSKLTFFRLCKFLWYYDDAFYYGLYKRYYLLQRKVRIWWGVNANCPINGAYPICFFLLASGNFVLTKTQPLWYFRQYFASSGRHYIPFVTTNKNPILAYLAFLLRKFNLMFESLREIWRGSHSVILIILIFTPVAVRCIYDCLIETIHKVRGLLRKLIKF
jgi:glycosyltransferase involved in cell wall biosynthesis